MIVMFSIITASIFVSGGYGLWQKELIIKGDITVIPDSKKVIPAVNNIIPNANSVEGNANPVDTQNNEQPSDATTIIDKNTQKPDQPNEQGEQVDKNEATEQVKEEIKQLELSKPVVHKEPAKKIEQIPEEQAPSNQDNQSSKIIDSSNLSESKENICPPQIDVGDKK